MKSLLLIILFTAICSLVDAQVFISKIDTATNDTIYKKQLKKVEIFDHKKVRTAEEQAQYERLKRKVIKLYPYALMAKQIYKDVNSNLDSLKTSKAKRQYRNAKETELRERFENEIKNLYTSDGPILVKLIYRETGHTTFDLLKELKSGFKAWAYQTFMAKKFGYSLKETYDPAIDTDIEGVIQSLQKDGTLPVGL
jgi:hypothetical protein